MTRQVRLSGFITFLELSIGCKTTIYAHFGSFDSKQCLFSFEKEV